MERFKYFIITILFIVLAIPAIAADKATAKKKTPAVTIKRQYDVETNDGFILKAYLSYPKTRLDKYPVVVLLHSLGDTFSFYNSFAEKLNNLGYAVVGLDLRGHGKSIYTKNLKQRSWQYFKNDKFAYYPSDVITVMEHVKSKNKVLDFSNYAIIGGDIGANTAVLVARQLPVKPKALVLFSPMMNFKGLYIPVAMTEIGLCPILAISSKSDLNSMSEQIRLAKFAQGNFDVLNTIQGGTGAMLLKSYPYMRVQITDWMAPYFKDSLTPITPETLAIGKARYEAKKAAKKAKKLAAKKKKKS